MGTATKLTKGTMKLVSNPLQVPTTPRPDLAGYRVQVPGQAPIWVIDKNGMRRWIPDPTTFNNLFRDWSRYEDLDVVEIALGPQLESGTHLIRADGAAPVYIVDQGQRRWITSPAIMDKYNFDWNKVLVLPPVVVNAIPQNPDNWE